MTDNRTADAGHLVMSGDRTKTYDMKRAYGPRGGDFKLVWPVTIEYDEDQDKTRVGFSYQLPPELDPNERNDE